MHAGNPDNAIPSTGRPTPSPTATLVALSAIFALAFATRLVYILQLRSDPFFSYPLIDSRIYDIMAVDFARGRETWKGAYFWPPLYPWFLGAVYSIFGHDYLAARVAHAFLGAVSCLFLFGIGRIAFNRTVGFAAACAMALCGPLVFFDGELLIPGVYIFLILGGLLLLLVAARRPDILSLSVWPAAGVVFGLAGLARPNIVLFFPVAAFWGAALNGSPLNRLRRAAFFLLGAAAAIAPVTVRNYVAEGDFVPISSNGGLNFYLGNNPRAEETIAMRPGLRWLHLVGEAEREGYEGSSVASRYYFRKALSFIGENPGEALVLQGSRLAHLWNSFEIGRNRDVYSTRPHSALLSLLLWRVGRFGFPFGLIAPLAAVGLLAGFRRDRFRALLYLFLLSYLLSIIPFFATSRYRLPLVPILLLFAAQYVVWMARNLRSGGRRCVLLSVVPLAIAFASVNRGYESIDRIYRGENDRFLGAYHLDGGRYAEAEEAFRRALSDDPDYADVHAELGQLLLDRGRYDQALSHLERAAGLCPWSDRAALLLAHGYAAAGRAVEAEEEYRRAMRIAPRGEAPRELGEFLLRRDRFAEAEQVLLTAIASKPGDLLARRSLIECYYRSERYDAMGKALDEALRIAPEDSPLAAEFRKLRRLLGRLP